MEGVQDGEHMASETISRMKQIVQSSLIDSFSTLESCKEDYRVNAGVTLIHHLQQKQLASENDVPCPEITYSLKKLIRGLATSNPSKRAGYFSVLVEMLKLFSCITLKNVLDILENEMKLSRNTSKKEITEVFQCQTLVQGALIHSDFIFKESESAQTDLLSKLLAVNENKNILFPHACSFLVDYIQKIDAENFQKLLWPLLKPELSKPCEEYSLDHLHLLLVSKTQFPEVINKKFLVQAFGSKDIINKDSVNQISKILLKMPININHPVYEVACDYVCRLNCVVVFWESFVKECEQHPNEQKEEVLLNFLEFLLQEMSDRKQIPELLVHKFMEIVIKIFQMKKSKVKLAQKANKTFAKMSNLLTNSEVPDEVRISFIHRILFYPGNLMFDKLAGTRIVLELSSRMKAEAIEKVAKAFRDVISAHKPKVKKEGETCSWSKQERIYAAQLYTRFLCLPIMEENIKWKLKQLKFLISFGLIASPSREPGDFASTAVSMQVRNCLFRALDQKVSKDTQLVKLLTSVVYHLNDILFVQENPLKLRQPLSDSSIAAWHKMMVVVKEIENTHETQVIVKRSDKRMFLILFLHMGLQLFQNAPLAEEALQSEDKKQTNKNSEDNEPYWVEVIVDLLLSLLSHSSHLLRNIVVVIFPYLCSHLTPAAVNQILQVLNPYAGPLSNTDTEGDDSEDEIYKNSSDEESGGEEDEDDDDDDDDDVDDDLGNAPVDSHLKMAVHNALKKAGGGCSGSDEESIDMDQMTKEERNGLDAALSEAFKLLKHNRADQKRSNKKQSKDDETLMHFRVRVVDLLELYLVNQPVLVVVLDIIIPLFELLEFCIKDSHQKPLENRIRHCLKKLSEVKQFSNIDGVSQRFIAAIFRRLLQKGERAAAVYQNMGGPLVQCSMDSLLPLDVFKSVLSMTWKGSWKLTEEILSYAFNTDIRPFRRHQALQLLVVFFSNCKLITEASQKNLKTLKVMEEKLSENTVHIFETVLKVKKSDSSLEVKEIFIRELLRVLFAVWQAHNKCEKEKTVSAMDWNAVRAVVSRYWKEKSFATDTKIALKKLANVLQISLSKKNVIAEKRKANGELLTLNEDAESNKSDVKENGDFPNNLEGRDEERSSSDTGDRGYESGNDEKDDIEETIKKRKRPKTNSLKGKAILKKYAKEARLTAMSEGLTKKFSFADFDISSYKETEDEKETELNKKKKRPKLNNENYQHNDSSELPKKTKVKRKNTGHTFPKHKKHKVSN
ncbi:Myb-binding protein 1A [Gryllus bimaculatus]|nr:Myb-binding protein 1A [Gryllus bimaculatus]